MPIDLDAVFFVEDPPEFEIRHGLVHIVQYYGKNGGLRVERVMRISTLVKTVAMAQRALAEYREHGVAEVINFPSADDLPAAHG